MSAVFISQNIWPRITKAVRDSRQRCAVAVAYFGEDGRRQLPLPKGSRLVVDASERAVASGQTCPADLLKLVENGVAVYSVPNLHAKVFVLGQTAYIGSINVSRNSATKLIETVIRTTEPVAVRAARRFVQAHCLHELTPHVLNRLAKIYRPPRIPGGKKGKVPAIGTSRRPTLPRLLMAQLQLMNWPKTDQALHDEALPVAKKRRKHPRSFQLDSFRWTGKCPYVRGDIVVQVTDEGSGKVLVAPPGNVLHVRTRRHGTRQVSFVYLERPDCRRRPIKALARVLGRGAQKRLRRAGVIRDASFAQTLLGVWAC